MSYFIWLYVVHSTSYERTSTNLQIVLNTPPPPKKKKSSHLQKILAQNQKSKKILPSSPSLQIRSTPSLARFAKAERFLKKLYINSLEMLTPKSPELFEVGF